MSELVTYKSEGAVAAVTMDDGKVNALSFAMIHEISEAFVRAKDEGKAVALIGRPGVLSAGLDLKTMKSGIEPAREMLKSFLALTLRIFLHPRPVVIGSTGHALAGGGILLLAGDYRVGAAGEAKVGLTEVAVGLQMPRSANVLVRERISRAYLARVVLNAEVFGPQSALAAGFLDAVVEGDKVRDAALTTAESLAKLPEWSFRDTKMMMREEVAVRALGMLEEEISALMPRLV